MSENSVRSPFVLALHRFWGYTAAKLGVIIVGIFFALAIFAPFLASDIALLWSDEQGLRFPVLEQLLNRSVYTKHYDLFFNLVSLVAPIALCVCLCIRKWKGVSWFRLLGFSALTQIVLFVICLVPLPHGDEWQPLWRQRALPTETTATAVRQAAMTTADWAQYVRQGDVLRDQSGSLWSVLLRTQRYQDAAGLWQRQAPDGASLQTVFRVRALSDTTSTGEYKLASAMQPVLATSAWFPLVPHSYQTPFDGAVFARPLTLNTNTDFRFWFGADDTGRDVLARMIHGARISLTIGFISTFLAMGIGIIIGALSGYGGRTVDLILQRVVEIMMTFPSFLLVLVVIAVLDRDIMTIVIVFALTGWAGTARLVRGEFLRESGKEYVLAARSLGLPSWRIMFIHILPNALTPLLISAAFGVAATILGESGLSFLGLIEPTTPSWGLVLAQARANPHYYHIIYVPGLAIFALVTALNLVGNGLRQAFDPRVMER